MTTAYDNELNAPTRAPLWVVEIATDVRCSNTYASAVSPSTCTASDLGDNLRCYYSYETCQDRANFQAETFTWRLVSSGVQLPATYSGEYSLILPILQDVSQVAQQVEVFNGFQRTDKMSIKCLDLGGPSTWPCPRFDLGKSVNNSSTSGSWWRRWVRQWPNFRNMRVTVKRGFSTTTFADADLATKWKGKLEGVSFSSGGIVTLSCVDFAADLDRKVPAAISTTNTVQADVSRSATSIVVANASEFTDPDDVTMPVTVEVEGIGGLKEYVEVTAIDTGTNTLTVTRGTYGTKADAIRADTTLREVLVFAQSDGTGGVAPLTAVNQILDRCGVASGDIDTSTLTAEALWVGPAVVRRTITEPKAGRELIQEILDLFQGVMYVTESSQISVFINRPLSLNGTTTALSYDENAASRSESLAVLEEKRRTHVVVYYDFPEETNDDAKDAQGVALAINGETYVAAFYGNGIEDKFQQTIKARWLGGWDDGLAVNVSVANSRRWAQSPYRYQWTAEMRDESTLIGDVVDVTSPQLVDEHGTQFAQRMTVIMKKKLASGRIQFAAEQMGFPSSDEGGLRHPFIHAAAYATDYDGATSAVQDSYAFVADDNETLGAAGDAGDYMF